MLLRKVAHQTFRLATGHIKIHQIPLVLFRTKTHFFFKPWTLFSIMKHNSSVFFHLSIYMLWAKRIQSKCKFSDFCLLAGKLNKFLMSFFKLQVGFPLNFALPFSVMTHNPSEIFLAKTYIL